MSRLGITSGLLILLAMAGNAPAQTPSTVPPPPPLGRVNAPELEGPTIDLEPIPAGSAPRENVAAGDAETTVTSHDALGAPESHPRTDRIHAPKPPPAPIAERPSGARPQPRAEWVSGYWDWDAARSEFFWMGGVWQVPRPGSMWVGSRWLRDQNGWYRASGFWSRLRGDVAVATSYKGEGEPAWRTTGPPADHPVDQPAAPPRPDDFFVPGYYAPDGDQLSWRPGFWAHSQPGWDWAPARWVRRPAGWEYRVGHWVREPDTADVRTTRRSSEINADVDRPMPVPGIDEESDPIAESEIRGRVRRDLGPIVVVPRTRMPYYMIRPPGMYGPSGVVVPGTVPRFVRDILDRVLP